MNEHAQTNSDGRTLIVCAVQAEAGAVARGLGFGRDLPDKLWSPIPVRDGFDVLISGVGKANGAGATAHALAGTRFARVLCAGVAGALPGSGLGIGDTVIGAASVFADEGVETPDGFLSIGEVGFPVTDGIDPSIARGEAIDATARLSKPFVSRATARGIIATVSVGSGTDGCAADIARRTGAVCEAMEGAAAALVCARLGVAFVEIRAISNTTGNRESQKWDLPRALDALDELFGAMA